MTPLEVQETDSHNEIKMSALSAKRYVDSVKGLASHERSTLKSLLDQGIIVTGAVIDGTPEELKDVIKANFTLNSRIHYSIVRSMDEEKSTIMKPTQEPSVASSLTTHSECNLEENFHQRVLLRDESCCLFCGDCDLTNLKAAHMLRHEDIRPPVLGADNTNELLQQYQLNSLYDTNNGITLCHDCNYAFEGELCCVQLNTNGSPISYKLIVANYLKYLLEFSMKWKPLDGKNIKIPKKKESLKYWPSVVLFQYREGQYYNYIMNWNGQNHTELTTCCRCYTRLKSISELANHERKNMS